VKSTLEPTGGSTRLPSELLRLLMLVGLTPAVMTNMISIGYWTDEFLLCWGTCNPPRLIEPLVFNLPFYTALACTAFVAGLVLTVRLRRPLLALSLIPYVLFVFRDWLDAGLDEVLQGAAAQEEAASFYLGNLLYNISASIVFLLCFVFARHRIVRTWLSAAYLGLLLACLFFEPYFGLIELLFFVASAFALRIFGRFLMTNWSMFGRIGYGRSLILFGKSVVFMMPILALIALGNWGRTELNSWTEGRIYQARPLCAWSELRKATNADALYTDAAAQDYGKTENCPSGKLLKNAADADPEVVKEAEALVRSYAQEARGDANDPTQPPKLKEFYTAMREADPCGGTAERDLETDLCYLTEYLHAGRATAVKQRLLNAGLGAGQKADEAKARVRTVVYEALPHPRIYRRKQCKSFPWLPCEIGNAVLWMTQKAVNTGINRLRGRILFQVYGIIDRGEALTGDVLTGLNAYVDDTMGQLRLATRAALRNGFDVLGIFDHLLLVILILAGLKSFLFIFARVCFSSADREAAIIFCEPSETFPEGKLSGKGKRYALDGDGLAYFNRRAQMEGIAPSLALPPPQPLSCVLARLISRNYLLNKAHLGDGRAAVFKTGDVREFVEWNLAEGEEVIFFFPNFIAMDASVRLSTYVSFRIATLLMGRFVFRVARGPGRLVLRPQGAAEIIDQGDAALSKPVHRFVAWHRSARFKLDAEQNFFDIYLSGVHMRKMPKDLVVVVAETGERKWTDTGAARFVTNFILPV